MVPVGAERPVQQTGQRLGPPTSAAGHTAACLQRAVGGAKPWHRVLHAGTQTAIRGQSSTVARTVGVALEESDGASGVTKAKDRRHPVSQAAIRQQLARTQDSFGRLPHAIQGACLQSAPCADESLEQICRSVRLIAKVADWKATISQARCHAGQSHEYCAAQREVSAACRGPPSCKGRRCD
jgi:hypothetical protein